MYLYFLVYIKGYVCMSDYCKDQGKKSAINAHGIINSKYEIAPRFMKLSSYSTEQL